jgi:cysteine desulfurase
MRQAGCVQAPPGYVDALGGQPVLPIASAAMAAAMESAWADPARLHHLGRRAGLILDASRSSLAASLSALGAPVSDPIQPDEVYFASSLAAAATFAIHGSVGSPLRRTPGSPVLASEVEVGIVLDLVDSHPHRLLPVDEFGRVSLGAARQGLADGSALICLQLANGEVGTRQPVTDVAGLAQSAGTPLLMDASASVGRTLLPAGWSMLMAAGRDWGGPAGAAVLVVRRSTRWIPPPGSERGWLGGFPDIPAAAGAAAALESLLPVWEGEAERSRQLVEAIRTAVNRIPDVVTVGDPVDRLPHVVTCSVLYANGEALVSELDRRGFAVASGSACVAEQERPSHVLAAMGAYTGGNIRISLPLGCTEQTVQEFLAALPEAIATVREPLVQR